MENKVVVIGLDGATFDIINPLIAEGKLPNLSKIFNNGVKAELHSSIPPISAPAWTSFLTGKNPGKHGLLGFQFYNLKKYNCVDQAIVSSNSYTHNTILDILSENNKRCISFQIPVTYPVWPINGIMVAGYPTPDQTKAFTYPENYSKQLGKLYEDKSDQIASGDKTSKIQKYKTGLNRVSDCAIKLLKEEQCDFFVYVSNITDWVQHKYWKDQFNSRNGHDRYIDKIYEEIDLKIGEILNIVDENTTIIIMSDHGAGKRPEKFFNINYLLRQKGLLAPVQKNVSIFTKTNRYWFEWIKEFFPMKYWTKARFSSSFREKVLNTRVYKDNINWKSTTAYRVPLAYPYVGVNINVKNRQIDGIIEPGLEFQETRQQVYQLLKEYASINPEHILSVKYQEEVYSGPHIENTPDIIVEVNHAYDSGPEIDSLITTIPSILLKTISGYHTPVGIFAAMGKNIVSNNETYSFNIMDIAPTVLYLLNTAIDSRMDGKILTEIIEPGFLNNYIPEYNYDSFDIAANPDLTGLSENDESEIISSLYEMGYL